MGSQYGIVDRMLLQAHMKVRDLVTCMDVNNFVHVDSVYVPQRSRGVGPFVVVHVSTILLAPELHALPQFSHGEGTMALPTLPPLMAPMNFQPLNTINFDVGDYFNQISLVNDLGSSD